jgi:hypothetical protein
VQVAGFYNQVLDTLKGVQVSGFGSQVTKAARGVQVSGFAGRVNEDMRGLQLSGGASRVRGRFNGVQVSGIFNSTGAQTRAVQIAGIINHAGAPFKGVQLAGIGNHAGKEMKGWQIAGLYNYTKNMKGVQFSLVNIADSSSGYSIGLVNLVKHGKASFSLYANEVLPLNLAWKSGNRKLYSIFMVGAAIGQNKKAYMFGLGLGKEITFNKNLGFSAELTNQNFYLGSWDTLPTMYRLQTGLNVKLSRRISLFGGPSFSMLRSDQKEFSGGYQPLSDKGFSRFKINNSTNAWIGWQGGLSWNYGGSQ